MSRYKNPYFWIGLVAALIAASGVDFEALTTWTLLADALIGILRNPVTLAATLMAGLGVFMNPTTKGLRD